MPDPIPADSASVIAISATVSVAKIDSRCRGWAVIVRAVDRLKLPEVINGASDLERPYLNQNAKAATVELFPGDYLIKGDANHHVKQRGWTYWLYSYDASGEGRRRAFDGVVKAEIKAAIQSGACSASPEILRGSGDLAAIVRRIYADRSGFRRF